MVVVVVIIWYLDLQLFVQSVPITTKFMNSNPFHSEVYSIQHYVIKFVSDLQLVGDFHQVLRFPPPDHNETTEILLKVAIITINQISSSQNSGAYLVTYTMLYVNSEC